MVAMHANGVSHLLSSVQSPPFPLSLFTPCIQPHPNRTVTRRHGGALDASARLPPASARAPPPSREPPPLTLASTAHAPNPHRSSTVNLGDHRAHRLEVPGEPRRHRCSASHGAAAGPRALEEQRQRWPAGRREPHLVALRREPPVVCPRSPDREPHLVSRAPQIHALAGRCESLVAILCRQQQICPSDGEFVQAAENPYRDWGASVRGMGRQHGA
jgi:hypothetical protein